MSIALGMVSVEATLEMGGKRVKDPGLAFSGSLAHRALVRALQHALRMEQGASVRAISASR
jgi:hypothetical protein